MMQARHAVTGAFGYSGKYIAQRLLDQGHEVVTLTNSPNRPNPFEGRVKAYPLDFEHTQNLTEALRGTQVLYNTYWVRFNHKLFKHADAVENTKRLFAAACEAGVERIVHVSITNPSLDSPLEYFRGKAELEQALKETGISHAILRPTVLFGREDILINNIAWALRRLPVFGVFGKGDYRVQPIHVDDLAKLAVAAGAGRENEVIDAIGPETFTYREMVRMIGAAIGQPTPVVGVPPSIGYIAGWLLGTWVGDVMITREEIEGLMKDLLFVDSPPAGTTRLSSWVESHADTLGVRYASELARRKDRESAYGESPV